MKDLEVLVRELELYDESMADKKMMVAVNKKD